MKKLMILAALLATVLLTAIPAIAQQVSQDTEQEGESGEVDQDLSATQEGSNSTQCAGIQGVTNTGNAQNAIGIIEYQSRADDLEFEEVGSTIDVNPANTTTCTSEVNQAASASG